MKLMTQALLVLFAIGSFTTAHAAYNEFINREGLASGAAALPHTTTPTERRLYEITQQQNRIKTQQAEIHELLRELEHKRDWQPAFAGSPLLTAAERAELIAHIKMCDDYLDTLDAKLVELYELAGE